MNKRTKRLRTPEEVEKMFPGLLSFINCTEQQIPRPMKKKKKYALFWKDEKAYRKDTDNG